MVEATLPVQFAQYNGTAEVSGWGATSEADTDGSEQLLYTTVTIVTDEGKSDWAKKGVFFWRRKGFQF